MVKLYWVALSVLALAACGGREAAPITKIAEPALRVSTLRVESETLPETFEATGTVHPTTSAVLSSKVMATVRDVKVEAGDKVRRGQVLVILDSREFEAGTRGNQAALDETKAGISETDSSIAAAKANLDLTQATFKRMKDLFAKTSISNQEYDEAQAKLRVAEANYQSLLAKRKQLDSRMLQTQEALRSSEIQQSYTRITAPFSGVVTEKNVQPGALATPGMPLLTLEDTSSYRIEAPVEESHWAKIRTGQTATVQLDVADKEISAKVIEVVPAIDSTSHSFTVKLALPASLPLRSGLFGRVSFETGKMNAIAVPAAAIREQGQLETVFVAEDGVARMRIVTLGRAFGEKRIVLSGLVSGEQLIYPAPPNLRDGATLEVRP